ncbi:hypothetical protein PFISCL1PPCAC_9014, partial [Pristionchus fissidentatus]
IFSSHLFLFPFKMASPRMIKLTSKDGKTFEVERDVIKQSVTVNTLITDLNMDDDDVSVENQMAIPLPNVDAATMKMVIDWCNKHKDDPPRTEEDENKEKRTDDIPPWDQEFLNVEQSVLLTILMAANDMNIKRLMDNCLKTIANMMKGKTTEEMRTHFDIKNDFTPEEEEQ